jgi:hypothetical protein
MAQSDSGSDRWTTTVTTIDTEQPNFPGYRGFVMTLRGRIDGDVRFDEYTKILYSTDDSIYQARLAGEGSRSS